MTTKLDDLSAKLERAVKALQGDAAPTRKRMTLDEFVTFVSTQIEAAAKEPTATAKQRHRALKRSVDDVIAGVAKMSAEDTESESIRVEVVTAFAPTKADGDKPMDDLTSTVDQSSVELDVEDVTAASGDSVFAQNLRDVSKSLRSLTQDLEPDGGEKRRKPTKKGGAASAGAQPAGARDGEAEAGGGEAGGGLDDWPLDMATEVFLKGSEEADDEHAWGFDPADVAASQAR